MSASQTPETPKRGRGRPATDPSVIERFHLLLDWGLPQKRAAYLCKPRGRGRPKENPEGLGRETVRRAVAERAQRTRHALPEGFTAATLKALPDDAVRSLAEHGPKSRQFRAACAPKPEKPALTLEQKREQRAANTARAERDAKQSELQAMWREHRRSGAFHYDPPPVKPTGLEGIVWPKMPTTEEAMASLVKRYENSASRSDRQLADVLRRSIERPQGGEKVSEIRRPGEKKIGKSRR